VRFLPLVMASFLAVPMLADDTQASDSQDLSSMDLESLLKVKVVTASKFSQDLADAPGVISVVTRDELRRFGGMTLREILERVPGLAGTTASFTDRSMVGARGDQTKINSGHILYLINGRPTREVLEGGIASDLLESFPVGILERIEVIKGPGSVLYGSNAFSAVVNLITQKADGRQLVVTGLGGPGGAASGSGKVMFERGAFRLVGAGQFHQNPEWFTPVETSFFGVQDAVIPDRSKGGYLGMNFKGLSLMSSFTDWTSGYLEGGVGVARWRRGFADLGYSFRATSRWDMSFNVTYTRTTLDAQQSIPFITRDSHEVVAEWSNVLNLTDRDDLTFGALFNHIEGMETFFGTNPGTVISDGSRAGEAGYAQIDHQLLESVKIIGGFQANQIGHLDLDVVPRGGAIWNVTNRVTVKALYSQAFRAPSLNETLLHYIPPPYIGGPSLLGNPHLSPEKVATTDIGVWYWGDRFQAGVDYFHSKLTNGIVLANVTTAGTYINSGKITFDGVEVEGKYYFKKNFLLLGSALYQTNGDANGANNVTPISNFSAKAGISYGSSKGLTVGLFDVYQGPIPGYSSALNPQPFAHHLVSANFRLELAKVWHSEAARGVALVAHAENLTNTAVWLPDWMDAPGDTIFANRGRTVYAGIEFAFKKD